jgi:hypothetical protein
MHAEPASVWMVLAKCTAGLAVIALITVIGYSEHADRGIARTAVAVAASDVEGKRAQEHRKQLFDQRRQRFQGSGEQHRVASEAPDIQRPAAPR